MSLPIIGSTVFFYADHDHAKGMKSIDDYEPFVALVASVIPLPEPPPPPEHVAGSTPAPGPVPVPVPPPQLVNLLVIDHLGGTFPLQSVPLCAPDDDHAKRSAYHCEAAYRKVEKPEPAEVPTAAAA